jgi:hypothetical protein
VTFRTPGYRHYGIALHRKKNTGKVEIVYTVEDERIQIKNFEGTKKQADVVKIYDNRLPGISFIHIKGNILEKTNSAFVAAPTNGVILSIQAIGQNSRFEFQSSANICINFAPIVESIQLMLTDITFDHNYESPGILNRLDIYIPAERAKSLLPGKLMTQLRKQQVLDLSMAANKFLSSLNEFLSIMTKELDKPKSNSLHIYFESFINSVTS